MFLEIANSPSAKARVHFFFAERAASKIPGVESLKPRPISKIGVVGGGLMVLLLIEFNSCLGIWNHCTCFIKGH
jgi:hypothetical protein